MLCCDIAAFLIWGLGIWGFQVSCRLCCFDFRRIATGSLLAAWSVYRWHSAGALCCIAAANPTLLPQSSSFLGFIFRILEGNPKNELLWGLWVNPKRPDLGFPPSYPCEAARRNYGLQARDAERTEQELCQELT